jgi:hypothetical protein
MAVLPHSSSALYVLLAPAPGAGDELLATVDLQTAAYVILGPTGRADLESLAWSPSGALYALGTGNGGTLCTINTSTGAATAIGGGGFGGDDRALAFLPDGTLLACGANLRSVNPATGATTLVGPTGFTDIIDLQAVTACYADCDGGGQPILNVNDFICFQARFAAGDPWANCDLSTTPPVLNVNDFLCFQRAFVSAEGCLGP